MPDNRRFPIQDGPSVPWSAMVPHEYQALKNHGQSLEKLASRGGLGSFEAWAVVNGWVLKYGGDGPGNEGLAQWRQWAQRANESHAELTRLRAIEKAVNAHLEAMGPCDEIEALGLDPADDHHCGQPDCTYCELNRIASAPG